MSEASNLPSGGELLKNSLLYRLFYAEREEILRHKWLESEKAGRDIGLDWAVVDWTLKHRGKWLRAQPAFSLSL